MHIIILFFSWSLCIPLPPINLLFMPCLPQKFLPHHVCEHLTQHICLLPMGTWCAGEFQYYTLQSRQFRLQWFSTPDVPFSSGAFLCRWMGQGADSTDTVPYREVARARLHFTQPERACLKDFFTGISNPTAVVLWGQTEINDGHAPINVCIISKLNSWQIKTEWAIFVTCIFPLSKVLINWSNHVYKFMRDQT